MKNLLYLVTGIAAAAVCLLVTRSRTTTPVSVDHLAHKLQDAWADHRTVV